MTHKTLLAALFCDLCWLQNSVVRGYSTYNQQPSPNAGFATLYIASPTNDTKCSVLQDDSLS